MNKKKKKLAISNEKLKQYLSNLKNNKILLILLVVVLIVLIIYLIIPRNYNSYINGDRKSVV